MEIKPIPDENSYQAALAEVESLWDASDDSPEAKDASTAPAKGLAINPRYIVMKEAQERLLRHMIGMLCDGSTPPFPSQPQSCCHPEKAA